MTLPISSSKANLAEGQTAGGNSLMALPNQAMFLLNLKRFLWLPVLHFVLLFLAMPFIILVEGPYDAKSYLWRLNTLGPEAAGSIQDWFVGFSYNNPFTIMIGIAVALLWAAVMFNYLNENKSVTFFHSLPFNRNSLFLNLILACFTGIALPMLAVALCCLILRFYANIGILYGSLEVLAWAGSHFLLITVIFSSAVLMGMFTGLPLVQTVFTFIFHLLPLAMYALIFHALHNLVYGFPSANEEIVDLLGKMPLPYLFTSGGDYSAGYCLFLAALILIFLALALWLYRRRPLENTGDIIVFSLLRPIFKYGVAFCASLSGSGLMASILGMKQTWWMLLLWGLIGYAIAEMLLQKSIRIIKAWKGACVYCLVLVLILTCIRFDLLGYEGRMPEAARVEAVLLPNVDEKSYRALKALQTLESQGQRILPQLVEFFGPFRDIAEDEESIAAAMDIHRYLIENKDKYKNYGGYRTLNYMLDGGKTMHRQYYIERASFIEENNRIIFENQIKKQQSHHLHYALPEDISWMAVRSQVAMDTMTPVLNQAETAGLLQALQQDLLERKYEKDQGQRESLFAVEFNYIEPVINWQELRRLEPDIFDSWSESRLAKYKPEAEKDSPGYNRYDYHYLSEPVYADYAHTLAWLHQHEYMDQLLPHAEQVEGVRLYFGYNIGGDIYNYVRVTEDIAKQEAAENTAELSEAVMPYAEERAYATKQSYAYPDGEIDYPYVYITDKAVVRRIIQESSWEPYCLPLGEAVKDRQIYQFDLLMGNEKSLFHGFYYGSLPDFLEEQAAELKVR
ncbi:MAG: hypothetical protein AAGU12_04220 [Clostridiales bacterium]